MSVAVAALALFASTAPASYADDTTAQADIVLFEFTPATLDVAAGTSVTWLNHDAIVHSVTQGAPDAPGTLFDSGLFDQDQTFTFTFTVPGEYTYFCTRHTFMHGMINVA
ncbi:MAG TPA: plastocyanin/azurin family copper-binding protein [Chloroflexota bacterium]|jgi:plastocyanin|nr:plastocyanin/azurin family copper-binding protein [Chloroflexota bacterium]